MRMTRNTCGAIIDSMAQLIVRNLDDEIVTRLRRRATEHGRSAEAEHREILREALMTRQRPRSLKEYLREIPAAGRDDDFARPRDKGRRAVRF
jgi:antitoxin FitA